MHTKAIFALLLTAAIAAGAALAAASISALAAPDKGLGMAIMSAVVAADGTRVRDAGVVDVTHAGGGFFRVSFNRSLTNCTCVASVGYGVLGATIWGYSATANCPNTFENHAEVITFQSGVGPTPRPFHLIVFCAK